MFTLIMLAICVPLVAGIAYLILRNRRAEFLADMRGIALQTVIIIVVLLAIAGSVAGVLLTRAGDVTSQLEATDVVPGLVSSPGTCTAHMMGTVAGAFSTPNCTWEEATSGGGGEVTAGRCALVQGTYTNADATTKAKCVKEIA